VITVEHSFPSWSVLYSWTRASLVMKSLSLISSGPKRISPFSKRTSGLLWASSSSSSSESGAFLTNPLRKANEGL